MPLSESTITLLINISFILAVCTLLSTFPAVIRKRLDLRSLQDKASLDDFIERESIYMKQVDEGVHAHFREISERNSKLYDLLAQHRKADTQLFAVLLREVLREKEQPSRETEEGGKIDIRFPDGRIIYVDSESRCYQFLEALLTDVDDQPAKT